MKSIARFLFPMMLIFAVGACNVSCGAPQKSSDKAESTEISFKRNVMRSMRSTVMIEKFVILKDLNTGLSGIKIKYANATAVFVENDHNKIESLALSADHVCETPYFLVGHKLENYEITGFETEAFSYMGQRYSAESIARDPRKDICVFRVLGLAPETVEIAEHPPVKLDKVYHVGAPLGTLQKGTVMMTEGRYVGDWTFTDLKGLLWNMYSIPGAFGSSGGGIYDMSGRLGGIVSFAVGPNPWSNSILCQDTQSLWRIVAEARLKWMSKE